MDLVSDTGAPDKRATPCQHDVQEPRSPSRAPEVAPETFAAPATPPRRSRREWADDYPAIIVRLDESHRVIECGDAYQWIWQQRGPSRWASLGFFLDRDVLIERCVTKGDALAVLRSLPARRGQIGGPK